MITKGQEIAVVTHIINWMKDRVYHAGQMGAVFGCSGGADSALVGILCKKAFPDNTLAVFLPCQSSNSSLTRARELCDKFSIESIVIDLEHSFTNIRDQFKADTDLRGVARIAGNERAAFMAQAALKSCLRAPVLDYVSKMRNSVIVGTGNRDEDGLVRYFQKRGDGCVDISPIAGLHKSEVFQLLEYLGAPQSIIDAVPTADLWGPDGDQTDEGELGMTYAEVEWADKFGTPRGVFSESPVIVSDLAAREGLTPRQTVVLQTVQQMERVTRHKANPPPVCDSVRWDSYRFDQ